VCVYVCVCVCGGGGGEKQKKVKRVAKNRFLNFLIWEGEKEGWK